MSEDLANYLSQTWDTGLAEYYVLMERSGMPEFRSFMEEKAKELDDTLERQNMDSLLQLAQNIAIGYSISNTHSIIP